MLQTLATVSHVFLAVAIIIGIVTGTDARPGQLAGGLLVIVGVVQAQLRRGRR